MNIFYYFITLMKLIKYVDLELSDIYKFNISKQLSHLSINDSEKEKEKSNSNFNLNIGDHIMLLTPTKIFYQEHKANIGEYFWVEIAKIRKNYYLGKVIEHPVSRKIKYGDLVKFYQFNIIKFKIKNQGGKI